jgi:hypothetical protein
MGSNHVEIEEFLTPERIEWAHGRAVMAQQMGRQVFAETGWRAAIARDPKLLKALERGAEVVAKIDEDQRGRTRRSAERFDESVETTTTQLWKEAYRLCDEGRPIRNFEWIYGAAALLCGYNT